MKGKRRGGKARRQRHIDILTYGVLVAVALSILTKTLNIYQFFMVDFVLTSFSPLAPVLILLGSAIGILIAFKTDAHWYFKAGALIGYVYGVILFGAILNTYGWSLWWVLGALLAFIVIMRVIYNKKIKF